MCWCNNGRHPFMQWLHHFVGRHDDYGAAVQCLSFTLPAIPEAGKGKDAAITHADVVGHLVAVNYFPLKKAVSGYQAAFSLE